MSSKPCLCRWRPTKISFFQRATNYFFQKAKIVCSLVLFREKLHICFIPPYNKQFLPSSFYQMLSPSILCSLLLEPTDPLTMERKKIIIFQKGTKSYPAFCGNRIFTPILACQTRHPHPVYQKSH